jgi:DNA-directed RNA polymerase subunit M/transcription elongation factor TFIIS
MPTTRIRPRPPRATGPAAAAAFQALGEQPSSPFWWIRPARRAEAAAAIAARVEARVHEVLAEQAAGLAPYKSAAACPKCGRNFATVSAGPKMIYVAAQGTDWPEHMLRTCWCGYTWREQCADGQDPAGARAVVDEAVATFETTAAADARHRRSPFAGLADDDTHPSQNTPPQCAQHYFPIAAEYPHGYANCDNCGLPYTHYLITSTHWQPVPMDEPYTTGYTKWSIQPPTAQDGAL